MTLNLPQATAVFIQSKDKNGDIDFERVVEISINDGPKVLISTNQRRGNRLYKELKAIKTDEEFCKWLEALEEYAVSNDRWEEMWYGYKVNL